ncbi:MAG: glycosyltransferase family 2 protein [Desulfomonilia bacterium]|jgi:glycosyltransferase involved in cell wall biosynthesis|nr:hypothetical protein [Desulfomonilia bacterium]
MIKPIRELFASVHQKIQVELLTSPSLLRRYEKLKRSIHVLDSLRFRLFRSALNRSDASRQITAVILSVDPNHLLEQCLKSVRKQTLQPVSIEIVKNVSPVSLARQTGLSRVKTEYYVNVDGDMVLNPSCFERLYYIMARFPGCAEVEASLEDPLLGVIKGIKMYRTDRIRDIHIHPVVGFKNVDMYMSSQLHAQGYTTMDTGTIEGKHHIEYTASEAFWKFKTLVEKNRFYQRGAVESVMYLNMIVDYWKRTRDIVAFYALAGLIDGMTAPDVSGELDYRGRNAYIPLKMVDAYLKGNDDRIR